MIKSFKNFNKINESSLRPELNVRVNLKENQMKPNMNNPAEKDALSKVVSELKKFHGLKQRVRFIVAASASSKPTKIPGGNKKIAKMRAYSYAAAVRDLLAKQGINIREVACGKKCSVVRSSTDSTLIGSFVDRRIALLPSADEKSIYVAFKIFTDPSINKKVA